MRRQRGRHLLLRSRTEGEGRPLQPIFPPACTTSFHPHLPCLHSWRAPAADLDYGVSSPSLGVMMILRDALRPTSRSQQRATLPDVLRVLPGEVHDARCTMQRGLRTRNRQNFQCSQTYNPNVLPQAADGPQSSDRKAIYNKLNLAAHLTWFWCVGPPILKRFRTRPCECAHRAILYSYAGPGMSPKLR
ncbi:hypothetical protein K466DRAFT_72416 [Polyporus arcularius HHB13444]|uniref:Uncharacterized protein n=1 Tax=Polyporus arcularius HHB13444 TaxID=1314778 RepID=A0A5C3PWC4_9APHY|nr:hypothetical protein K466DRAFT_72416 [Polyporus arcularius HHB13444]